MLEKPTNQKAPEKSNEGQTAPVADDKKKNKKTLSTRKTAVQEILTANTGKPLTKELSDKIMAELGSSKAVVKENAKGEVFCNYFGTYLPKDQFNISEKGKIPSMSTEGQKLARSQKSAVNKATSEVLAQFKAKEISADEMAKLLATIDKNAGHRYPKGTKDIAKDYPFKV